MQKSKIKILACNFIYNKKFKKELKSLIHDFKKFSNKEKAEIFKRFFKTGKGEYGEGD